MRLTTALLLLTIPASIFGGMLGAFLYNTYTDSNVLGATINQPSSFQESSTKVQKVNFDDIALTLPPHSDFSTFTDESISVLTITTPEGILQLSKADLPPQEIEKALLCTPENSCEVKSLGNTTFAVFQDTRHVAVTAKDRTLLTATYDAALREAAEEMFSSLNW